MTRVKNSPALSTWSRDRHTVLPSRSSVYGGGACTKRKAEEPAKFSSSGGRSLPRGALFGGITKLFPYFHEFPLSAWGQEYQVRREPGANAGAEAGRVRETTSKVTADSGLEV